jgi:Tol biopolymer transport system component
MSNDLENRVREALQEEADLQTFVPRDARRTGRQAKRRLVRNGIGSSALAVAALLGVVVSVGSVLNESQPKPFAPPTASPSTPPPSSHVAPTPSPTSSHTPPPSAPPSVIPPGALIGQRAMVRSGDLWILTGANGSARLTRVTHDGDVRGFDGWFPDGRSLLIERGSRTRPDLVKVVLGPPATESRVLPGSGIDNAGLSPDGTTLARCEADGLYTVPLSGGSATRLVMFQVVKSGPTAPPCLGHPIWAPDGSQIAYIGGVAWDGKGAGGHLSVVGVDGSGARSLAPVGFPLSSYGILPSFAWAPDGARIAYTTDLDGSSIKVVDVSTGASRELLNGGSGSRFALDVQPGWSADGRWLFFSGYRGYDGGGPAAVDTTSGAVSLLPH